MCSHCCWVRYQSQVTLTLSWCPCPSLFLSQHSSAAHPYVCHIYGDHHLLSWIALETPCHFDRLAPGDWLWRLGVQMTAHLLKSSLSLTFLCCCFWPVNNCKPQSPLLPFKSASSLNLLTVSWHSQSEQTYTLFQPACITASSIAEATFYVSMAALMSCIWFYWLTSPASVLTQKPYLTGLIHLCRYLFSLHAIVLGVAINIKQGDC